MDHGSIEARFLVSITKQTTLRRHLRAIPMKQSCYLFSKIYYILKFQPSRWIMAPSRPDFSFRSQNKLGPLGDNFEIGYMVPAHTPQDHSTKVSSTSNNFQGYFLPTNCEPRITHIRPSTLKRKSGCPSGINNQLSCLVTFIMGIFGNML